MAEPESYAQLLVRIAQLEAENAELRRDPDAFIASTIRNVDRETYSLIVRGTSERPAAKPQHVCGARGFADSGDRCSACDSAAKGEEQA